MSARTAPTIDIDLHAKQGVALQTRGTEVLYGGAAGGGKSFLMRSVAVLWCASIPGLQVYLFRRLRDDLVKNHIEGPKGFRSLLAPWVAGGFVGMVEDEIRFWNGSKIYLCHCKDEKDRFKYLGAEIHVLLIDELTTFTEVIYRFLRGRVRMVGAKVPGHMVGRFPRILCGSNPGNVGHHWVKSSFVDARPPLDIERMPPSEGGMLRQYIPAKLEDNPSMTEDDPGYEDKLSGLGNDALVKAMRDGDWNVVAGAFFTEFSEAMHVVEPRSLPAYWLRFRSFDWGSARPFSVGWWAVSDGELPEFPRGALIRYREWYGASSPNVGLRLTAEEVADGIKEREKGDIIGHGRTMGGVADPSIFAQDGGPSIADRMSNRGVFFRPADNKRVSQHGAMGGWDQLRSRLKGDGEVPGIFFFSTCRDLIRTLPALQHDDDRPEDVDTESEDHSADECFVAGTMIQTADGERPIETIEVGDMVQTRRGLHPVVAAFSVGERDVMRVGFSKGRELVGTPSHPIFVEDCGFVPLRSLRYADMLRPCQLSLSAQPSKSSGGAVTISAAPIFAHAVACCIALFGRITTAAFQGVRISTTLTMIRRTISQTIWPALIHLHMNPIMANSAPENRQYLSPFMLDRQQPNGTDRMMGRNGTSSSTNDIAEAQSTNVSRQGALIAGPCSKGLSTDLSFAQTLANQRAVGLRGLIMSSVNVLVAAFRSLPTSLVSNEIARSSVPMRADMSEKKHPISAFTAVSNSSQKTIEQYGAPTVVGEPTIVGKRKVYNLSVDDAEEYFANGVLVHNCRYACMSRPYVAPLPANADQPDRDKYARRWRPASHRRGSSMAA